MIGTRHAVVVTLRYFMLITFCVGFTGYLWGEGPTPSEANPDAAATDDAPQATTVKKLVNVEYAKHGEVSLLADLFIPKAEGAYPGILMVHGGAWRHGSKNRYTELATKLAERGYSVMAIDYRLAPQHKFPAQLEDCVTALAWMHTNAKQYKVDKTRIGAWGYSAGGQLVALLGATMPGERASSAAKADGGMPDMKDVAAAAQLRLQAVVAGGTPTDFRYWLPAESKILTYWLGKTRAEEPEIYQQASPRHYLSKDDPPMFFYHGEKDAIVPVRFGRVMVRELTEAGVQSVFHLVPDKGHLLARFDEPAVLAGFSFLDQHLKSK